MFRPLLVLGFLLVHLGQVSFAQDANMKPNIILIMVDDMGWSDIASYGGEINTPHLDRLAKEGMRFRQFYNNAKCTTTRASLLTGLYPRRDKSDKELLRPTMLTLGEILKLGGYHTALSGKWHLGRDSTKHPRFRGFDEYYGLMDGCCNFFDPSLQDPEYKGGRIRFFADNFTRLTSFPEDFYTTDAFTDHAIEQVKIFAQRESPFFLHITYTAPHYPIHALPEDIAKYEGKFGMGWEEMRRQRYQRQLDMGLIDAQRYPLSKEDSRAYSWEEADHNFEDKRMAVYAAMIDRVDQNIGRLLETLEETGEAENTLILFLSDNGGCAEEPGGRDPDLRNPGPKDDYVAVGPAWGWAQNAPFRRYKTWMHEGGVNTPFIAWWPEKIPADTLTDEIGHIIDLLPTLADIAEVDYPDTYQGNDIEPVEGQSIWPILTGGERQHDVALYWEYSKNRAMRDGRWKLVWDKLRKEWELYDMNRDRTETNNLALQEVRRVKKMAQDWEAWAKRTGVSY